MKWIGQHIYDYVARFRNDVYLTNVPEEASSTGQNLLVIDGNGKVHYHTANYIGDITEVVAGTGLDGGGDEGSVTLTVDVSDFMTNGGDNRILTATGTDAMNAEADFTYTEGLLNLQNPSTNLPIFKLENTSDLEVSKPTIVLYHHRDNGSQGDIHGEIYFKGSNVAGTETMYSKISSTTDVSTAGQESGILQLMVANYNGDVGNGIKMTGGDSSSAPEVDVVIGDGSTSETTIAGSLTVTSDLTVSGTTTTVNTTNLNIEDKNITLNYNASSDTSSSADGAGITIQDAVDASNDASLTWVAADDAFIFSHPLTVTGDLTAAGGTFSSSTSNRPLVYLQNTTDDATGPTLHLQNIRDGNGLSTSDVLGNINFDGEDASGNFQSYAQIKGTVSNPTHTNEAGQIELLVTASNGSTPNLRNAFKAYGHPSADKVAIELGYGTGGDVACAGSLSVVSGASISNPADGGTPAVWIQNADIDQIALNVSANNTTANIIDIGAQDLTTSNAINIDANSLTTGSAIYIDVDDALTATNTKSLAKINYDKSGVIGASATADITGLEIALNDDATNHSLGASNLKGIDVKIDYDNGTGAQRPVGVKIEVAKDGTIDALNGKGTGWETTVNDGGLDFKCYSSANDHLLTGDWSSWGTTANGATTITTYDHSGTDAHFEIAADGNITLDAAGDIFFEAAGNDIESTTNNFNITSNTTSSTTAGAKLNLILNDGAAPADDHQLGKIAFYAAEDGSSTLRQGAQIKALADAAWSASENGTRLEFWTMDGNNSSELSLTLDSDLLATFAGAVTVTGALTGTLATAAQTNITSLGTLSSLTVNDTATFTSSTSNRPYVIAENTGDDATGPTFYLRNVRDGNGLSNSDTIGIIKFDGEDGAGNSQNYAQIIGTATSVGDGDEAGKIEIIAATSNGTTSTSRNAFTAQGHHSGATIETEIGYGAESTATIAGDLLVTSGAAINNPSDGGTASLTVANLDVDQNAFHIDADANTTGHAISVDANSLTTGSAIFLDIDDALTASSQKSLIHIDYDKAGVTADSASTIVTGLDIDINDNATNHANSTQSYFGVQSNITWANDAGLNTGFVYHGVMSGGGGTSNQVGLVLDIENGGTDIKCRSTADTGDYFAIKTEAHGATTLWTVDDDATAAHFEIAADGDITLDAEGDIKLEPKSGGSILLDGTIDIDAGVVTGATSITSTAFVGTLSTAAQTNITSLGTLTSLNVGGSAIVGAHDGDDKLQIERYSGAYPYSHIFCGAQDQDVKVGFKLVTRNTSGVLEDAIVVEGDGKSATFNGPITHSGINLDTKTITITGDTSDTFAIATGAAGATTMTTTDAAGTAGHFEVAADGNITLDAAGSIALETAGGSVTSDTASFVITNASSGRPTFSLVNGCDDADAAVFTFDKNRYLSNEEAGTADGDKLGTIQWSGTNNAMQLINYASIVSNISEVDDSDEAGKLTLNVAASDGSTSGLSPGLILEGEHATGSEVDVTIANGAASTTTVAGNLMVTTGVELGHASDTTIARSSAGVVTIEGNRVNTASVNYGKLSTPDMPKYIALYLMYQNNQNYWYTPPMYNTYFSTSSSLDGTALSASYQARAANFVAGSACVVRRASIVFYQSASYLAGDIDLEFALVKWTPNHGTNSNTNMTQMTMTDNNGAYTEFEVHKLVFDVTDNAASTLAAGDCIAFCARTTTAPSSGTTIRSLWYGQGNFEIESL